MKDGIGNNLKVGDLVQLALNKPLVFGRVAAVEKGAIVSGLRKGGDHIVPDKLVIVCNHTIEVDPTSPVAGSVIAIRDPAPPGEEAILQMVKASSSIN